MTASTPPVTRRRDAAATRQLLLDAARQRFAREGYAATTVREIADDAGVNVALISRYFESKEGLFEACLAAVVEEMDRTSQGIPEANQVPATMARQIAGANTRNGSNKAILMLLLRPSGDERTEAMRIGVLRGVAERLAAVTGWESGHPDADQLMLRSQVLLAASLGITLLRAGSGLEPLASATEQDLAAVLTDLFRGLFDGQGIPPLPEM